MTNAEGANPLGNAQAKGLQVEYWLWRAKYKISTEGFNFICRGYRAKKSLIIK